MEKSPQPVAFRMELQVCSALAGIPQSAWAGNQAPQATAQEPAAPGCGGVCGLYRRPSGGVARLRQYVSDFDLAVLSRQGGVRDCSARGPATSCGMLCVRVSALSRRIFDRSFPPVRFTGKSMQSSQPILSTLRGRARPLNLAWVVADKNTWPAPPRLPLRAPARRSNYQQPERTPLNGMARSPNRL